MPATNSIHDESCTSRAKKSPGPGKESGDCRTRLISSIFSSNMPSTSPTKAMKVKERPRGRNDLKKPSLRFQMIGIRSSSSATTNIRQ